MNRFAAPLLGLILGSSALLASRPAHALGPVGVEIAAKVGAGSNPGSGDDPNILGFGFGARAGVTILGLYGGLNIVDYLGSSSSAGVSGVGGGEVKSHALLYGVELGYGLTLADLVTIRAQVGLGSASITHSGTATVAGVSGNVDDTSGHFYLEPGLTGLIWLGKIFIGADVNYLVIPSVNYGSDASNGILSTSKTLSGVTIHGQIGVGF